MHAEWKAGGCAGVTSRHRDPHVQRPRGKREHSTFKGKKSSTAGAEKVIKEGGERGVREEEASLAGPIRIRKGLGLWPKIVGDTEEV